METSGEIVRVLVEMAVDIKFHIDMWVFMFIDIGLL
jgi:hypothetical protein